MDHRAEEKGFSVVLSEEDIAAWSSDEAETLLYGCRRGDPYIEKWIVQESPRGERELSFHMVEGGELYLDIENRATEVHFIGRMLDGTVFASSGENESTFTFIPTQEDVMEGFSLAVSSMEEGEKALFNIPAKLALTKSGCPTSIPWNIPPNQTFWLYIELISFTTDILGDQGIMRKTVKIGEGDRHPCDLDEVFGSILEQYHSKEALYILLELTGLYELLQSKGKNNGSVTIVNYIVFLEDGTLVSKSEGVEFKLAEGFFCPAFAHALKTMTEGDEVFLVIKPQYGFGECGRPSMGNEIAVPPDSILHVNLQLISWKTVSHIGENGEIVKTTFSRAKFGGHHAHEEAIMKVRLIGKLQDGTVFDRRGYDGQEPEVLSDDQDCSGNFVAGLKEAILTMVEGDIASVTIPPQHAFGTVGSSNPHQLAVVPPNSVVIYQIELLSVEGLFVPSGLSRRKLKQDHERRERLMSAVPPAASLQEKASKTSISVAIAPEVLGGQSPAASATPTAGGSSATTANTN